MPETPTCPHVADHVKKVKPASKGCADCLAVGDTWVHVRMCTECGYVGCCDSSKNRHARGHFGSKNRHARGHFAETQHPIIQSAEKGEDWKWCYVDGMMGM